MVNRHNKKIKILIVEANGDDDRLFNVFTSDTLDDIANTTLPVRYQIVRCQSLDNAFQIYKRKHPDVVIINLHPDQEKAFDLCRTIRGSEDERHTGLIFYQGHCEQSSLLPVTCLEHGADDYIESKAGDREIIARVNTLYRFKVMTDELRSANHRLKILSLTDELTGLHNMRSFNTEYAKILQRAKRGETGFGIVMLDLDRFKQINDKTNHLVGSYVIGEVGKILRLEDVVGRHTVAARYGGDEYILCVPADSSEDLSNVCERIRDMIGRAVFERDGYSLKVTTSVGYSWIEAGFSGKADDPIKAADVMLYRSKHHGRNQINGMVLRYPVDFDHVSRSHLIDRDASSDDDRITRIYNV